MTEQEEKEIAERYIARERYAFLRGVFDTYPCNVDEAEGLSEQIRAKLRSDWNGEGGFKDGVDLGLACRIIDTYAKARKPKPPDSA